MNTHPPTGPAEPTDPTDRPGPEEEAYLDRLRAVDPASTAGAPDLDSLRAAVAARVAAGEQTGAGDDLAARRHARRGWPVRAAAAAAVVVVGSGAFVGGYALGDDAVVGAAPAISLSRPASGAAEGAAGLGPVDPQGADQGSVAEGLDAPEAGIGGWWGRVDFTSSGLSGDGGRAEGWGLDPSAGFSSERAEAAAAALGVEGAATLVDGRWQVGPDDGTGAGLSLSPDGEGSLSYYDPTKDPWWCDWSEREPDPEGELSEDGATSGLVPDQEPCVEQDLGPAPEGDAALAQVRDAMTAVGVDPADYELVVEDYGDPQRTYVSAYQVVDAQRSGLTWSASLTGAGVASLYGSTARLVPLGEYDVVSPVEAVDRLGDPRFGGSAGYPVSIDGVAEDAVTSQIAPAPEPGTPSEPTLPPAPQAGQAISWPVSTVEITGARLGLALTWQQDGSVVLAPTYELTGADGSVWSVIAVADTALDFTAAG